MESQLFLGANFWQTCSTYTNELEPVMYELKLEKSSCQAAVFTYLSISDKADTLFHQCSDVEVVGQPSIDCNDTAATAFSGRHDHFVGSFGYIGFEHQSLLYSAIGIVA
jgi:hypothetical protein